MANEKYQKNRQLKSIVQEINTIQLECREIIMT